MGVEEGAPMGVEGFFGAVVVVAEMAEKHVGELRGPLLGHEPRGNFVVEMAVVGDDAGLEMVGVGPFAEHLEVVVTLDDHDVDLAHVEAHAVGDRAEVGGDGHARGAVGDEEPAVVRAVVGDVEGRDGEVSDLEFEFLVYCAMVFADSAGDGVAPQQSVHGFGGAEDVHVAVVAEEGVDVADVVAVVVGEEDSADLGHGYAVVPQGVDNGHGVDSGVDEESAVAVADVGAVSAGARAEADEEECVVIGGQFAVGRGEVGGYLRFAEHLGGEESRGVELVLFYRFMERHGG